MPRLLNLSLIFFQLLATSAYALQKNGGDITQKNPPSKQMEKTAAQPKRYHVVKPGETLYRIGVNTGIGHQKLAEWNGLPTDYLVRSGQTLKLFPGTSAGQTPAETKKTPPTQTGPTTKNKTQTPDTGKPKAASAASSVSITPLNDSIKIMPLNDQKTEPNRQSAKDIKKNPSNSEPVGANKSVGNSIPLKSPEHKNITGSAAKKTIANPKPETKPTATNIAKPEAKKLILSTDNKSMLKLSFQWPLKGVVLKNFSNSKTKGIDIASRLDKQAVKAAETGKVVYKGQGTDDYQSLIVIKHSDDFLTVYANNSRILVKEGEHIRKGHTIAEILAANGKQKPLHFEIRKAGRPINALGALPAH